MIKIQIIVGLALLGLAAGGGAWAKIERLERQRLAAILVQVRAERDAEAARAERNADAARAITQACEAADRAVNDAARRGDDLRRDLNQARDEVDRADDPLALDRLLERLRGRDGPPRSPGGNPPGPAGADAPARDP